MDTHAVNDYDRLLIEYNELKKVSEYRQAVGDEFIKRMRYDFNTLLNSITGYLYAVYETADQAQKPTIDNALKTSTTLLNRFGDMTDYISLIMGGYLSEKSPTSFRLMLRQISQKLDGALSAKNLDFDYEFAEEIPEYVETDYAVVRKVVSLLVENALQNSPSGAINAFIELVSRENDILKIKFSVSDCGDGVDADEVNKFLSGREIGDGGLLAHSAPDLGLQIARDFLELLGAGLSVQNNDNGGSTFSFVLDVIDIASAQSDAFADSAETEAAAKKALSGITVLLADDSVIIQQIALQMLVNEGASVTAASNGKEAVSLFSEKRFDVVLMDIEMPTLNGYEATRQITSIKAEKGITVPVIGMTAHTGQAEHDKCIECGMSATITKPFKADDIMEAIFKELFHTEYTGVEKAADTEKTSIYNFEKIKGIDYKEGVNRLGGSEKVYFELLQNFRDGYSDIAANISSLLKEGQDNEVKSILHLIKGISGNLSFNEVYDYANKLREAVDHDNIMDITKYLKLFEDALLEFKLSFSEAEVEILYNMSELMDVDLLLVKERLTELLEYLSGDVDLGNAVDACNDVYDYVKETEYKKDFERIKDAIGGFDVETAEVLLKTFISRFA